MRNNLPDQSGPLIKEAELILESSDIFLLRLNHSGSSGHGFRREDVYWIDLCLTPRRPDARARYVDHWGPHRFHSLGGLIALPPGFNLQLRHGGGAHASAICALHAEAVERWLPSDFEWTDRRLEACLDITNSAMRSVLLKIAHEVRYPGLGARDLIEALVLQLSVELARHLQSISERRERGGLAAWRLRTIEKRLAAAGDLPTLEELADLCDISVRQLTRGFRTSRSCTLGHYMAQTRIEAAKRRLATDESLKSIALSIGFSSQSTFTCAFRRATGVTPRDFRQRLLRATRQS